MPDAPAPSGNERLRDALLVRAVHVGKYADGLGARLGAVLADTEAALRDRVLADVAMIDGDLTTRGARARLRAMDASIAELRGEAWARVRRILQAELAALAVAEARFFAEAAAEAMPVVLDLEPPPEEDVASMVPALLVFGYPIALWLDRTEARDVERIGGSVRMSIDQALSAREAASRVVGSRSTPGVTRIAGNHLAANADTLVTAVAAEARVMSAQANDGDGLFMETYVATLDASVTDRCRSLDQKRSRVGEGPRPPQHHRCRSVIVISANQRLMGERPFKRGVIGRDRYDVGRVPASMSYREWVKTQSEEFQKYAGDRRKTIRSLDELAAKSAI